MKKAFRIISITIILAINTCFLNAQPNPWRQSDGNEVTGGQSGGCYGCGPTGAPIDSGTGILLMLAVGYAIRKVRTIIKTDVLI